MINTLTAQDVPSDELDQVDDVVRALGEDSQLGHALRVLAAKVRAGEDVFVAGGDAELTPAKAAKILGMSRGHLYKVLDAGTLPSHNVGRDRRIKAEDLIAFGKARDEERGRLAERFAHADRDAAAIVRRLADVDADTAARLGF